MAIKTKKFHSAFSLLEVTIVIVLLSILMIIVTGGQSLITSAKVVQIVKELKSLDDAVTMFSTHYGCLPGDCNQRQVPDLIKRGLDIRCANGIRHTVNTGAIDEMGRRGIYKHICAIQSLKLSIFRSPADNADTSSLVAPTKFNPETGWFIRGVSAVMAHHNESDFGRDGFGTDVIGLSSIDQADHLLFLSGEIRTERPRRLYGINALIAHKLDSKFDDGLPYTGNIRGTSLFAAQASNTYCSQNRPRTVNTNPANRVYIDSRDPYKGCDMFWLKSYR
jgi:prepilin-type N-terminal cleavage/methylation domain-containing protein